MPRICIFYNGLGIIKTNKFNLFFTFIFQTVMFYEISELLNFSIYILREKSILDIFKNVQCKFKVVTLYSSFKYSIS